MVEAVVMVEMSGDSSEGLLSGGWERFVMSSLSLSSSLLAEGRKGGGAQWWLGRHLTWKRP